MPFLIFHECYVMSAGLLDWGHAKTQFVSVSWNWNIFISAGYRNEKYASDLALIYAKLMCKHYLY